MTWTLAFARRAPDVSPALSWYPIVSTVQLVADMAVANSTPPGFGHNFAVEHYIDAWHALMEPAGWTLAGIIRLKALLRSEEAAVTHAAR